MPSAIAILPSAHSPGRRKLWQRKRNVARPSCRPECTPGALAPDLITTAVSGHLLLDLGTCSLLCLCPWLCSTQQTIGSIFSRPTNMVHETPLRWCPK